MQPRNGTPIQAVPPATPREPQPADDALPGLADRRSRNRSREADADLQPHRPDPTRPSWIEIELLDAQHHPVPGERYRITLADGATIAEGTLDENGRARVEGIDPGVCKVRFPDRDIDSWQPARS